MRRFPAVKYAPHKTLEQMRAVVIVVSVVVLLLTLVTRMLCSSICLGVLVDRGRCGRARQPAMAALAHRALGRPVAALRRFEWRARCVTRV